MKIVKTTLGSRADARRMADLLVSSGFAKCASIWKIESAYFWKGRRVLECEYALEAKCEDADAKDAAALVESEHQYEIPMVLVLDVEKTNRKYEKWMKEGNDSRG